MINNFYALLNMYHKVFSRRCGRAAKTKQKEISFEFDFVLPGFIVYQQMIKFIKTIRDGKTERWSVVAGLINTETKTVFERTLTQG